MICAVLASLAVAPPVDMPVAMVANFYNPKDRNTYFQVYLASLDGKTKRQLTKGTEDYAAVYWQGKESLILVKFTSRWEGAVIRYEIKTGKQTVVEKSANSIDRPTPGKYERGRAVFYDTYRLVEFVGTKLVVLKKDAARDNSPSSIRLDSPDPQAPGRLIAGDKSPHVVIQQGGNSTVILRDPIKYGDPVFLDAYNARNARTYVVTSQPPHNKDTIYQLDWKKPALTSIATGFDMDFQPGSRWMSYLTEHRFQDIDILRSAWVNQAVIVDRSTGKKTTIGGLVNVQSMSLRKVD